MTDINIDEKDYEIILKGLDLAQEWYHQGSENAARVDDLKRQFSILCEYLKIPESENGQFAKNLSDFVREAQSQFNETCAQLQAKLRELMIESFTKDMGGENQIQYILAGLAELMYAKAYLLKTYHGKPVNWIVNLSVSAVPYINNDESEK